MTLRKWTVLMTAMGLGLAAMLAVGCGGSDDEAEVNRMAEPVAKQPAAPAPEPVKLPPPTPQDHEKYKANFEWVGEGERGDVDADYDECLAEQGKIENTAAARLKQSAHLIDCMAPKGWKYVQP